MSSVTRSMIFLLLVLVLTGCADPTEGNFYVHIVNDTSQRVSVGYCRGNHCQHWFDVVTVKPGGTSGPFFASAGEAHPVAVIGPDSQLLGCLPNKFGAVSPNVRVAVSSMSSC
jgi:hypothetical protein